MGAEGARGLAASLAENTRKVIARRGADQAEALFEGQIDPSRAALRGRTNFPGTGDKAPLFTSPTLQGEQWSLKKALSGGAHDSVVLVFYRGSWCSYCNLYLRGLLEVQEELAEAGALLIAVSPEAAPVGGEGVFAGDQGFLTLVDENGQVGGDFGLTFEMNDGAKDALKSSGIDLEQRNANGQWVLPVPGTFVIDRDGEIAYAHVDPDYRNRPEPSEIVAICRSLKR